MLVAFIDVILAPEPVMLVTDISAGNLALSRVPEVMLVAFIDVILAPAASIFVALILPATSNVSDGSLVFIPTLPVL